MEVLGMEHKVVSHEAWVAARKKHLVEEKEFTKLRDRLSQAHRDLPWELVEKEYVFESESGRMTLADLFDGRRQLIMYHAMWDPDNASPATSWTVDAACPACSFWCDNINGIIVHLNHRDVSLVVVSRAPVDKIVAYKRRMGWSFPWVSSGRGSFNNDYAVSFTTEELERGEADYNYTLQDPNMSEREGLSVFARDREGRVFHTYSAYARGIDLVNTAYNLLDLVPKGRDEEALPFPLAWIRRNDEYEDE